MIRARSPRVAELALYLVTALVTIVATAVALELWRADLTVPFDYQGDALAIAAHTKTVIETGWYEWQPLLGAPAGQVYHDFPTADNLNFALLGVIGLFAQGWALTMNLYYLIGFPLAAVTAVLVLRDNGVSRPIAGALGVVYALASYHFLRGEAHLFLASYFVVPLALLLVLRVLRARPLWGRRPGVAGWRGVLLGPGAGTVAIAVVVGTAQSYYAVYLVLLIAFAGLASLLITRDWRRFWGAAAAGALVAVVMLANMLPDLVYRFQHGANPAGFERGHAETEVYGFKLAQLLLPWGGHRIGPLAQLRQLYDSHYPLPSEHPVLGAIAAAGFVALIVGVVLAALAVGRGGAHISAVRAQLGRLGALALVIFLFATTGGLATFVSFVTTSLRGGNRISIYLMLVCLVAVGILVDVALRRLVRRDPGSLLTRVAAPVVAATLVIVGFIDQTPGDASARYAATAAEFRADAAWFAEVEETVGPDGLVLQLPYQPYPEELGPTGVLSSETLVPYLHTTHVRWSGGGIQGRPESDWPGVLEQFAPEEIAELAAAAEVDAILVDRRALFAVPAATLEEGLLAATAARTESADGRYALYPLAAVRERLRAERSAAELDAVRAAVLDPVVLDETAGFTRSWSPEGELTSRAAEPDAAIRLIASGDSPVPTVVTLELASTASAARVEVVLPDGRVQTLTLGPEAVTRSWRIDVPPGVSELVIRAADGGTAPPPVVLRGRSAVTATVADFLLATAGSR